MIAANAEPVFIMPLAVPEHSGAMSIGIAHIGPIVISAKKKPDARHAIDRYTLCVNISGMSESRQNSMHTDTIQLRARFRLPVRVKIQSVTMPPTVSPITPARNTTDAKIADFFRSR